MVTDIPEDQSASSSRSQLTLAPSTGRGPRAPGVRVLRSRLGVLAMLVSAGLFLFLLRTPFIDGPATVALQIIALAIAALVSLALRTKASLGWRRLRTIELVLLTTTTVRLVGYGYLLVRDRALSGNTLLALGETYQAVIGMGALIVLYGMLVPNTWRRALVVVVPMALAPFLPMLVLHLLEPDAFVTMAGVYDLETISNLVMTLCVAVLTATYGAHTTHSLRAQASEALALGQYRLEERLASGGMGEIWRATHRFLARPAAIKVVHRDRIDPLNPEAAAVVLHRFEREAQATAALESRNTVRIYDFGSTDEGDFYYAMELLNGLDLESLVRKNGPVCASRAIHFLCQACDSLAEAHAKGQIHRDVKPSNLFACKLGRTFDVIKVLDFGLVTRAGSEPGRDARLSEDEMLGTPAYMAPEQVLAVTRMDKRVDIYALGCVGYWLLTGHTVFDIDRPLAMAVAHVKARPMRPSLRTEVPIPADLERLVLVCLEKDPDRRPASAEELAERLGGCADHGGWTQEDAREWWLRHGPEHVIDTPIQRL